MHQAKAWRPGEGNIASVLGQFSVQQLSWMPGALHVRIGLVSRRKATFNSCCRLQFTLDMKGLFCSEH